MLRFPLIDADSELSRLVEVINGMLDRLEKSFGQAVRFSADAAHELQTPLTIPSNLTADMGSSFLSSLTSDQAGSVIDLVNIQRNDLNEIVATRRSISTQLRRFITESSVDSTTVLNLARRYGELDGEIVYNYATHFVQVSKTLSSNQEAQLMALRETWNTIPCSGAYLYSAKINMPEIMNTDFLFGASGGNGVTASRRTEVSRTRRFLLLQVPMG